VNIVTLFPTAENCRELDRALLVKVEAWQRDCVRMAACRGHNSCRLIHPETGGGGAYQAGSKQHKAFMLFTPYTDTQARQLLLE